MAKLTKFKAQQVEFGTHYKIEETNRGDTKIKSITPAFGNIREPGTPETEEIYDGLQLGNVHTLQANKTTNLNIDYYVCNLDGLNEFGVNNDLKLRINVDSKNTNSTTKLRLNNNDYTLLKEYNGNLKQIEAGDFKPNKTYELTYNGSQFIVINVDSRLNEIMGLEFGGNIQDAGDKVKGKCYFDNVTKFYYECIEDNSLTYNDSGKFRAISNKPLSDKVENLCKIKRYSATTLDYMSIENGALVISEVRISDLKNKIGIPSNSTIISVSAVQSVGYCEYCTYNYESDTAYVGHIVPKNNPRTVAINVTYI